MVIELGIQSKFGLIGKKIKCQRSHVPQTGFTENDNYLLDRIRDAERGVLNDTNPNRIHVNNGIGRIRVNMH
jgi:hypothetical protein